MFTGRSGAGKTTLIHQVIHNLSDTDINFLATDYKEDGKYLYLFLKDIYIFRLEDFRFNPLQAPDNTEINSWIQIFADVFFESFFTPPIPLSAKSAFLDILFGLTSKNKNLLLSELDAELDKLLIDPKISGSYKQSVKTFHTKIKVLIKSTGKATTNSFKDITSLLTAKKVVLILSGISVEIQSFIVTILFYWIFTYRIRNSQRGKLKHVLIFDEAKMVFSSDKVKASSQISRLVSTAREFGEGLLLGEQSPHTLADTILANLYGQISLSLSGQKDIQYMSYNLGLDEDQRKMLYGLKLKTGICRLADRYTKPFIFHIPHIEIDKNISDSELKEYMAPKLAALELLHPENKAVSPEIIVPANEPDKPADNDYMGLDDKCRLVLDDFKEIPFISNSERRKKLNLTTYMFDKICKMLIDKGFILEERVKINDTKGPPVKLYPLTPKSESILGKQCLGPGHGGFLHRFWQHHHRDLAQKHGFGAIIEKYINSKPIDVYLFKGDFHIAVEICITHYQKELDNIKNNITVGIKNIWMLASTQMILDSIEADWLNIKSNYPAEINVEFHLLSDSKMYSSKGSERKGE